MRDMHAPPPLCPQCPLLLICSATRSDGPCADLCAASPPPALRGRNARGYTPLPRTQDWQLPPPEDARLAVTPFQRTQGWQLPPPEDARLAVTLPPHGSERSGCALAALWLAVSALASDWLAVSALAALWQATGLLWQGVLLGEVEEKKGHVGGDRPRARRNLHLGLIAVATHLLHHLQADHAGRL